MTFLPFLYKQIFHTYNVVVKIIISTVTSYMSDNEHF